MASPDRGAALTLMAVHAHPDDEASSTGGVLARYATEGVRTIVVTCTNGELGDGPDGVKPGEAGHDEAAVAAFRRAELERSCQILNVSHLELLGYHDSGMVGWEGNDRQDAFCNVPVDAASSRLIALMERYRPQVVITYDENGNYGHPDHIQANRITLAAVEACGIPEKMYYTAIPRSGVQSFAQRLREAGVDLEELGFPESSGDDPPFGTPDELIGAIVDVTAQIDAKREALLAHSSQTDNSFFMRLPEEAFASIFSAESFVRQASSVSAEGIEDDLFAGLR
jgi:LmbE family N-acetylglucosaminyl deacetylase